jgi:hypothetical protein
VSWDRLWHWNPNPGAGRNVEIGSELVFDIAWHTFGLPSFVPKRAQNVPTRRNLVASDAAEVGVERPVGALAF